MDKITPKTQFGKIVRERIKQYGYKECEYAEKIGMSVASLSRYIRGDSIPDYISALKICNGLNLDINKIDTMDITEMQKDTQRIIDLRTEFEKLGVIEEGQDLTQKQLDLLRGLILSNKTMFQVIDTLIAADDLLNTTVISGISNHVKND